MDIRRRFKADISDNHLEALFSKKKPVKKRKMTFEQSNDKKNDDTMFHIPAKLLPRTKKWDSKTKSREYKHPSHWVVEEPRILDKSMRKDILKKEEENINTIIARELGYSRGAKSLTNVRNKDISNEPTTIDPELADVQTIAKARERRHNASKKFLKSFFDKANLIASEMTEKKMIEKKKCKISALTRVPKLASGVEPSADEIIL